MSLADRCESEVVALHEFFADWFAGRIPETDESFDRVADALGDSFEMVAPSGERRDREAVLSSVRAAHGDRADADPPFEITVESFRPRDVTADRCLATYEEHQRGPGGETARLSTALFEADPDAPAGVAWLHLHETWLPGRGPDDD